MKTKGVRILDQINGVVSINPIDILKEIHNGWLFHWSILDLYGMGNLGIGKSISALEQEITELEKGLFIEWDSLSTLLEKIPQLFAIVIIGCKEEDLVHRYENDQDMYETCDVVIQMIDSAFWEVFSKDDMFIDRLSKKFKDVKFLESDFLETLSHEPNP